MFCSDSVIHYGIAESIHVTAIQAHAIHKVLQEIGTCLVIYIAFDENIKLLSFLQTLLLDNAAIMPRNPGILRRIIYVAFSTQTIGSISDTLLSITFDIAPERFSFMLALCQPITSFCDPLCSRALINPLTVVPDLVRFPAFIDPILNSERLPCVWIDEW
jgi:hypothetical protein